MWSFPRVRGDVPTRQNSASGLSEFSPRARGCSAPKIHVHELSDVFPACAGMFPHRTSITKNFCRVPRVRGDVPMTPWGLGVGRGFSPRARGCSYCIAASRSSSAVFPACAGMFLRAAFQLTARTRFPRVRGDVPIGTAPVLSDLTFSPRARGCSLPVNPRLAAVAVFPACAGMFLRKLLATTQSHRFPRVRGDVPTPRAAAPNCTRFSPRARGCSLTDITQTGMLDVFPACAGMFLPWQP